MFEARFPNGRNAYIIVPWPSFTRAITGESISNQPSTMEDKYIWAEVKKHSTADDLYLVIKNKVYDVTKFQHEHPYVYPLSQCFIDPALLQDQQANTANAKGWG